MALELILAMEGLVGLLLFYISHTSVTSLTVMQIHQNKIGVTPAPLKSMGFCQYEANARVLILFWCGFIDWGGGEAVSAGGAQVTARLCLCLEYFWLWFLVCSFTVLSEVPSLFCSRVSSVGIWE